MKPRKLNPRRSDAPKRTYIDPAAIPLFERARKKFKRYSTVAEHLCITPRTLAGWRLVGLASERKWGQVKNQLQMILENHN